MSDRDPFQQLTGAFDRPVAPAPAFAARLRAQVLAELVDVQHMSTTAAGEDAVSGGASTSLKDVPRRTAMHTSGNGQVVDLRDMFPAETPRQRHRSRRASRLLRWLPALEIAAAVLLILTLFGQLIGPETLRNAVIPDAFQPAHTPPPDAAAMWGANPGRTWEFGGVPSPSAPGQPTVFAPTEGVTHATAGVVSGDMVVRLVSENRGGVPTQHLEAVSLRTGQRLWILPLTIETLPAIAGGRVFIAAAEFGQGAKETFVVALDQTSGAELWRTPIAGSGTTNWTAAPLVVGSTVYVANNVGTVHALDIESGAIAWRALMDVEQGTAPNGELLLERAGTTAADTEHLYVTTAAAELVALNLQSGEVTWRIPLAPQYGTSFLSAKIMTDDSMILLDLALGIPSDAPFSGPELATAIVVGLDAHNGQQRWIRRGLPPSGVRVLAGGLVVAAIVDDRTSDGSAWINVMRATDGTVVWLLTDNSLEVFKWSAVGDQLLVVTPQGRMLAHDLSTGRKNWEAALPPIAPTSPPLVSGNEIVVLGAQAEIAVYRFGERSSSSTPVPTPSPSTATPLASPFTSSDMGAPERSTGADGSWTFDAAVPATAPGAPEVFPATNEGHLVLVADVAGDTLVRLTAPSIEQSSVTSVEAVSLTTGERRWAVPVPNAGGPIIADGRVFVVATDYLRAGTEQSVLALDLATGEAQWKVPFPGQRGQLSGSTLVVGSTLYVSDALGVVQALDVATGDVRWNAPGGIVETAISSSGVPLVEAQTGPVADDRLVYTHTADGVFRALDLATGDPVWSVTIVGDYADRTYFVGAMADDGTIILDVLEYPSFDSMNSYATPADGPDLPTSVTVALDAVTGRELWRKVGDADSEYGTGADLIGSGLVLAYGLDGKPDGLRPLVALRAGDGTESWRSDVIPNQSTWWSMSRGCALAIVPGGPLVAIDLATGEEAWRVGIPPIEPANPPLITEDALIVVGTDGQTLVWRI